jgi:hypothetical protein
MKCPFQPTALAILAASGLATSAATAQQFLNRDFETGDLTGWTIEATTNGQTLLQTVAPIDIDFTGALGSSNAAHFNVGNLVQPSIVAGIELYQTLDLAAGVEYAVSFDWASTHSGTTVSNLDGGQFDLLIDSVVEGATVASGSIAAGCIKYGYFERFSTPTISGPHRVGIRMRRSFLASPITHQWLDNTDIRVAVRGACCLTDGTCESLTQSNCLSRAGVYQGDNASCEAVPCTTPATGACCAAAGTCDIQTSLACVGAGGTYAGDNSACAGASCPTILSTTANNGSVTNVGAGVFLNLTATHALAVGRIDFVSAAGAGNWAIAGVWTFQGSYVGNDASPTGWTLHESQPFRSGNTLSSPVSLYLSVPIPIGAAETVGVCIITTGGGVACMGTSAAPSTTTTFADPNLSLFSAMIRTAPFGGTPNTPRTFVGRIHYTLGGDPNPCYPNCDQSTVAPILNVQDFTCFLQRYAAGESYANCDNSTVAPVLNVQDFTCVLQSYAAGCP